jgi:fucose permease
MMNVKYQFGMVMPILVHANMVLAMVPLAISCDHEMIQVNDDMSLLMIMDNYLTMVKVMVMVMMMMAKVKKLKVASHIDEQVITFQRRNYREMLLANQSEVPSPCLLMFTYHRLCTC